MWQNLVKQGKKVELIHCLMKQHCRQQDRLGGEEKISKDTQIGSRKDRVLWSGEWTQTGSWSKRQSPKQRLQLQLLSEVGTCYRLIVLSQSWCHRYWSDRKLQSAYGQFLTNHQGFGIVQSHKSCPSVQVTEHYG